MSVRLLQKPFETHNSTVHLQEIETDRDMLDYEWGNPSTIMLTGNEDGTAAGSDQTHRQIFDHYASHSLLNDHFLHGPGPTTANTNTVDFSTHQHQHQHHHHFNNTQAQAQAQHHVPHTFFDPRAFHGASSTSYPPPQPPPHHPSHMLSLDPLPHVTTGPGGPGFVFMPKSEDVGRSMDFVGSRIGLNLGGRTYFSSSEDDLVSRLYRRSRPGEPGSTMSSNNSPRCQAEGCNADLSQAKHYHRRHKVCEFHSKAATVIAAGLTQRFCQQCSRFHLLSEFDNGKRSCRKRLADHNRRRRKTQQSTQEIQKSQTALDNIARSPADSGTQSSSSVTVAVSPPDYFRQRQYQSTSPSNSSSLFFSSG